MGGRASDTARRASTVTSRYGDTLFSVVLQSTAVSAVLITLAVLFIRIRQMAPVVGADANSSLDAGKAARFVRRSKLHDCHVPAGN